jgi:tetratricopeptide (TPR) repeat protein
MYLGVTLIDLRRYDEAEKEFVRALSLGGDSLSLPHYYLGGIYWQKRDYKRAADELEKYLKLSPKAPDAERTRAAIKELRGKQSSKQS